MFMTRVSLARRKRGEKGEVVETVEDVIVRRLTAERIDELKRLIKDTQEKHRYTGFVQSDRGGTLYSRDSRPSVDLCCYFIDPTLMSTVGLLHSQEAEERGRADPSRTPGPQTRGAMGRDCAV